MTDKQTRQHAGESDALAGNVTSVSDWWLWFCSLPL
jgi:hypothetical protein